MQKLFRLTQLLTGFYIKYYLFQNYIKYNDLNKDNVKFLRKTKNYSKG